ncbi:MAG: hypothetical protein E7633_06035 [Ruminococcaceae bacterium]|nr:hypothetical protein [Oscillospiraceae bacterium]
MSKLEKNREYSVLFIGNSYTYFGDMPTKTFEKAAKAAGYDVKVTSITSGGYTLLEFADSADKHGARVDEALAGKKYDFVIMQEQSQRPASDPIKFIEGLSALHNKVKTAADKEFLYSTWGRKAESDDLTEAGWTSRYMTDRLAASYTVGGEKIGAEVCYVGLAFADIYENYPEINVYDPDCSHPSAIGSYLAGITIFAKIFGFDPRALDFDGSFDKKDTEILKTAAYKAVFEETVISAEQKEDVLKILA